MSEKVTLYIVRHGKTMFNALTRTQGWCDSPLTPEGQEKMLAVGRGLKDVPFLQAFSSDSGRAIETTRLILSQHPQKEQLQKDYTTNPKIREWSFGSLEGGYNGELWGVVPRILLYPNYEEMITEISYEDLANAIKTADTAGWAEPFDVLKNRIVTGFEEIAKEAAKKGSGNVLVVSHNLTIASFLNFIGNTEPLQHRLANGSVSKVIYENGQFTIIDKNNLTYLENGEKR